MAVLRIAGQQTINNNSTMGFFDSLKKMFGGGHSGMPASPAEETGEEHEGMPASPTEPEAPGEHHNENVEHNEEDPERRE